MARPDTGRLATPQMTGYALGEFPECDKGAPTNGQIDQYGRINQFSDGTGEA
jgi:hypothetical protein